MSLRPKLRRLEELHSCNECTDLSHHPKNKTADFDMAVVSTVTLAFFTSSHLKGNFQINVGNSRCTGGLSIEGPN